MTADKDALAKPVNAWKKRCKWCGHVKPWHGNSSYASQGYGPDDVLETVCFVGKKRGEQCECSGFEEIGSV